MFFCTFRADGKDKAINIFRNIIAFETSTFITCIQEITGSQPTSAKNMARTKQGLFGHHQNNHICGCYFTGQFANRSYLPQVKLASHATINPVSFTTKLTQTFHNPNDGPLEQCCYTFPLFDGVAVNGYTISYGDKVLRGIVKQKHAAKQTYQAAVDRGETAGLLESLPAGVFGVTLANIPSKTDILVQITYCGELKHDAGIDGLRYMLPTSIAPRYGNYPGQVLESNTIDQGGISITVDIDMGQSNIRKAQSPSHPIAVSMGGLSTSEQGSSFRPSQASATLTQGSTELDSDFILQLVIDDISKPQAIVETHPTLPNQRAIMTTLVPKFVLEPAHPEIIFIADQSGSMSGTKDSALISALKVFLKSLPLGVRFNICAFGSHFQFLWPKSQAYNEDNVAAAVTFVDSFNAQYGGTEILKPLEDAFKRHLKDLPLEVMLLTDGQIWGEDQVFEFVNEQIAKGVDARIFALGIGEGVSHTLVEGVARAGNGFAQFVTQDEELDQKVIRMLKGALYPHTTDYSLEVNYGNDAASSAMEDDFEIVERVNDCLVIDEPTDQRQDSPAFQKITSFFDTTADVDKPTKDDRQPANRYAHLPAIDTPKILQAPAAIPPLFPFNRTTAYLLLGPQSAHKNVVSVTVRAKSPEGPLELTIPISGQQVGTSIHQLAARKAIQDLQEGRGWLHSASVKGRTRINTLVKEKYKSRLDEIVEREGVRLGEKFQVASKWTSFVAVEDHSDQVIEAAKEKKQQPTNALFGSDCISSIANSSPSLPAGTLSPTGMAPPPPPGGLFGQSNAPSRMTAFPAQGSGLFGAASAPAPAPAGGLFGQSNAPQASSLFGSSNQSSALFGHSGASSSQPLFQQAAAPSAADPEQYQREMQDAASMPVATSDDEDLMVDAASHRPQAGPYRSSGGFAPRKQLSTISARTTGPRVGATRKRKVGAGTGAGAGALAPEQPSRTQPPRSTSMLHRLIALQFFTGAWMWNDELLELLGLERDKVDIQALGGHDDNNVPATVLVVAFLEVKLGEKREVWEMVVQKAKAWMQGKTGDDTEVERLVESAKELFKE